MRPHSLATVALLLSAAAIVACRKDDPAPPPPRSITLIPPLQDAQVGEWIRLVAGPNAQRMRVVDANDFEVTIETTRWLNGEPSSPTTQKWHRNGFGIPADAIIRKIEADRIEVGGKWHDCWRLEVYSHVRELQYWLSSEVPATGLLKIAGVQKGAIDEANAASLVESDWGREDPSAPPQDRPR